MVKYKLIIEYYQKGNNNSQIATLCGCSRTVVWEVLNRFNKIETIFADIQRMSEEELRILLFPERVKKDKGYRNGNERIRTVHDKDVFYYAQLRRNENR